jgi:hypothetical protein
MKKHGDKLYKINKYPKEKVYNGLTLTWQGREILDIINANGGSISRSALVKLLPEYIHTRQEPGTLLRWWQSKMEKAGILTITKVRKISET